MSTNLDGIFHTDHKCAMNKNRLGQINWIYSKVDVPNEGGPVS